MNKRSKIQPISKNNLNELTVTDENISQAIRVSRGKINTYIPLDEFPYPRRIVYSESKNKFTCSYIPTQFVSLDELASEWDKIALTEHEKNIRIALKFIEPLF